jgi:acyl carrier protein
MLAAQEIYGRVVRVLAESLYVEESKLLPTSTLQGDLGAESIDLLELIFRLENEFEIDIPDNELFPRSLLQSNSDFVREGIVTHRGMSELRSRMPYADLGVLDQNRRLRAISDLFTVELVARYIIWKLGPAAGTNRKGGISVPPNASPTH